MGMISLIGNRDGVLSQAAETLDQLGLSFEWGAAERASIVILDESEPDDFDSQEFGFQKALLLRVPVDFGDDPEAKIAGLKRSTESPGGTLAIGRAGAVNAALQAARVLAVSDECVRERLADWITSKRDAVLATPDPSKLD